MQLKPRKIYIKKGLAFLLIGLFLFLSFSTPVWATELEEEYVQHENYRLEIAEQEYVQYEEYRLEIAEQEYVQYEEYRLEIAKQEYVQHEEYGLEIAKQGDIHITMTLDAPVEERETFIFEIAYRNEVNAPITDIFYHVLIVEAGNLGVSATISQAVEGIYTVREISKNARFENLGSSVITQEINEETLVASFVFTQRRIETNRPTSRLLERSQLK